MPHGPQQQLVSGPPVCPRAAGDCHALARSQLTASASGAGLRGAALGTTRLRLGKSARVTRLVGRRQDPPVGDPGGRGTSAQAQGSPSPRTRVAPSPRQRKARRASARPSSSVCAARKARAKPAPLCSGRSAPERPILLRAPRSEGRSTHKPDVGRVNKPTQQDGEGTEGCVR